MDLQKIDNELINLEPRKGMQYHVANHFIDLPWGFAGKTPYAGKIFFAIISMIDFTKDYQDQTLRFDIDEIANLVGISRHGQERYDLVRTALETLNSQQIHIDIKGYVDDGTEKGREFAVNGTCNWIAEFIVNDYTREAFVRLPKMLRPILLNLKDVAFKGNVQKVFETLAPFSSHYFIHLYLLMEGKAKFGTDMGNHYKPSLEKLYDTLCLKQSYRNWQNFKSRILDVFLEDVAKNDAINFLVKYEPVYAKKYGKGRKAVNAVEFWIEPKLLESKAKNTKKLKKGQVVQQLSKDTAVEDNAEKVAVFDEKTVSAEVKADVVDVEVVEAVSEVRQLLLDNGVLVEVADQLVKDYPEDFLLEQISDFKRNDIKIVKSNPGAFLCKKIENGWKQLVAVSINKKASFLDRFNDNASDVSGSFAANSEVLKAEYEQRKQEKEQQEAERKAEEEKKLAAKAAHDAAVNRIVSLMSAEQKSRVLELLEFENKMMYGILKDRDFDEVFSQDQYKGVLGGVVAKYFAEQPCLIDGVSTVYELKG